MTKDEFKDIAPYDYDDFRHYMEVMINDPGFEHAIRYIMPEVDYPTFSAQLLKVDNPNEFQRKVMAPFLETLAKKTTSSLSMDGFENIDHDRVFTFISNHRDIVLDASFLNICLIRENFETSEIALGDNLLIYDWIEHLVKVNKGFIVKRNLKILEAFKAAKQLSGYIRHCLIDKHESVWIAQREGRAKDSDDRTQESVVKMLALSGPDSIIESLKQLNICPTTISYEYDPNDYLKAAEFLQKNRDPEFKKSSRDDLHSMEIGLLGYKGRVHFHLTPCINAQLDELSSITDKNELFPKICEVMDRQIHLGYRIYPANYISYDRVYGSTEFASNYTAEDVAAFDEYLDRQLAKVDIADVTEEEMQFMRSMMLKMYSNPLRNKLKAQRRES